MKQASDREFMQRAVFEARKCVPEDNDCPRPLVGAVAVVDGRLVGTAFRGELGAGEHAEYTLLEKKLRTESLAGATVYTTLEPCTSRNHPKVPCVSRLIDRRVSRVVVGMLDPNQTITGKGILRLRRAGIEVDLFPADLMAQLEDLNRDFTRAHDAGPSEAHVQSVAVPLTSSDVPSVPDEAANADSYSSSSPKGGPISHTRDSYSYKTVLTFDKSGLTLRTNSTLAVAIRSASDDLCFVKHFIRVDDNPAARFDHFQVRLDSAQRSNDGDVLLRVVRTTESSCIWRVCFEPKLRSGHAASYQMSWSHIGSRFLSFEDMQLAKASGRLPPDRNQEKLSRGCGVPCSKFRLAIQFPKGYEITDTDFSVTTRGLPHEREKQRVLEYNGFSAARAPDGWLLQLDVTDADPRSSYWFLWTPPAVSSMERTGFLTRALAKRLRERIALAAATL